MKMILLPDHSNKRQTHKSFFKSMHKCREAVPVLSRKVNFRIIKMITKIDTQK